MAVLANSIVASSGATVTHLLPRRRALAAMADQAEALCLRLAAPVPTVAAIAAERLLNHLCEELWALDLVILALTPADHRELVAQAAIARQSIEEHLPSMPLLDKLLQHVERFAA